MKGQRVAKPEFDNLEYRFMIQTCNSVSLLFSGSLPFRAFRASRVTVAGRAGNIPQPATMKNKTKHPLYWTWRNIILRCSSSHKAHFRRYKGRGITMCNRWLSFDNFVLDMGTKPDGFSIDRINNNGNYEPSNCRWADAKTQMRNRGFNRHLTLNGKTQLLSDWASELGILASTISMRLDHYGWSVEKTLTTKTYGKNRN